MVETLTDEAQWMTTLSHLPAWDPPGEPVLIVVPHPDDETLGCGGLIAALAARGVKMTIAAVTDGENAYPDDTAAQAVALGPLRQQEQTRALSVLGVNSSSIVSSIVRLHLPDSAVQSHRQALAERLAVLAEGHGHILAPWRGDFHPDHEACGVAAEAVARDAGLRLTSYFFWTWHRGDPGLVGNLPLRAFALDKDMMRAKADALLCHQSQLHHVSGDPVLPERILAPARRPFEVFLVAP